MTVATASFDSGVNGNAIATTDTGAATPWTVVTPGGGGNTSTYDNAHVAHGTLAAKLANGGVAVLNILEWDSTVLGTLTQHYGRFYLYKTANPVSNAGVLKYQFSGGFRWSMRLNSDGTLSVIRNDAATVIGTTTNALASNQFVRVEWFADHTIGQVTILLFNSPDSATPTETMASSISANQLGASANDFQWQTGQLSYTIWLDQMVAGATAYPGSFPVNSVAPTVSGLGTVGATLTANPGTWNGTFTLTYQWTSDGADIGGATGTTYVAQAGDGGHAIGVREIATGQQATNESASQASSNTITVAAGAVVVPGPAPLVGRFP